MVLLYLTVQLQWLNVLGSSEEGTGILSLEQMKRKEEENAC